MEEQDADQSFPARKAFVIPFSVPFTDIAAKFIFINIGQPHLLF
jgi:hypothetical protein